MKSAGIIIHQDTKDYIPLLIDEIKKFSKKKRQFLKAIEIL